MHPTRRCNLACAHCYSSSGPTARQALDLDLLSRCLEDAAQLGYRHLAVSGGEPLLYRGLAELLGRARTLGMRTSITTNGMLATAERWGQIASLVDMVALSIDGTPSEHDAIRRRRGAFAATVRTMEAIRASGVPFGVRFTLTRHSVDSLDFVVHLAARSGARSVEVQPLTLHGRATAELPHAQPSGLDITLALSGAARLGRDLGIAVRVDALTTEQLRASRHALVPARPVADLVAIAPVLVVDADATVLPLTHEIHPRFALGSLERDRLAALARDWMGGGSADLLADTCARTWTELTDGPPNHGVHWHHEVAAQTRRAIVARRPARLACN